jgi:PAS domain S-box-containing protein
LRRLLGAAIDITGRKQAEKALQESEERSRLAQDAADVGVFDWNIQTGEIIWTPRFEAMYGLPPGGLAEKLTVVDNKLYLKDPLEISKLAEKLVHPEDKAKVSHLIEEAFMTGEPVDGQWRLVWPDGSIHWQSFRIQLFKDELGKPKRLTGISIDITESELAEEEQRRNSENMMMLIRESQTSIIFVNSEGNIIIINKMAENLLGYGPEELLGYPLSTIFSSGSSLKVEDRKNYPMRIVSKLGTEIPSAISTSVQPFKDKKSGIQERGMIVILKDLSELHGLSIAPTREVEVMVAAEDAKPVLELGYIYLVEEDHPSRSLAILKEMMEHGAQGLYISREKPERIRNTYHLEKTPFIWLTRNKVPGENCIAPDELTKLNKTAENFIEKADQGILFFDGLEYLIAQNGFNIVLQFFYSLNDAISLHNSLAIFVIDPLAFEPRELHILRRESRSLQA